MGARRKLVAILDTETTMKREVFDIGILIVDFYGNIIDRRQWIIDEAFKTKLFYENKRELYMSYLENNPYTKYVSAKYAIRSLENMLTHYKIKEIYAYNMQFDSGVIKDMAGHYDMANPFEGRQLECLWLWSCSTILQQKSFREFCEKHQGLKTEKGNFKTSAEATYAYLTNAPGFVEEHTALQDCYIEYDIFLRCKRQNKTRVRGIAANPWLLAQEDEQIEKLPPQFRTMKLQLESQFDKVREKFGKLNCEKMDALGQF